MPWGASWPTSEGPWVDVVDLVEDYARGAFRVIRAVLRYRRFDGQISDNVARINFERGDSVGVLLYDPKEDNVVLVRQFRYPVYASLEPVEREGDDARQAWLLEIAAGVMEEGLTIEQVARKELLEETGYEVDGGLRPITTVYLSPGGSSERIHLFLCEVGRHQRTAKGGGLAAEGENVQVVALPLAEAMDMVARGEICDAKTVIALQYLCLLKATTGSSS